MQDRRLIEEAFPMKEVSEESTKEKHIQHGHISSFHVWWARRPLAASRATNYSALIKTGTSVEEMRRKKQFVVKLSKWKNSLNKTILDEARSDILTSYSGIPPKVLDPFSGGGAIPLESLRLGCETFANDYNPVTAIILKCTLEYPQKYAAIHQLNDSLSDSPTNRLTEDIKRAGQWVLDQSAKEIKKFYPYDKDNWSPVGYIWSRTVPCQNPTCGAEIPLIKQYWLAKTTKKRVTLYPYKSAKRMLFKVAGTGYGAIPKGFDPSKGTVSRAIVTCFMCGSVIDNKTTSQLFREGKAGEKMLAVILNRDDRVGKKYRAATNDDYVIFRKAENFLEKKREELLNKWGLDPVPDEPTPDGKGKGAERAFSVRNYNMNTWGELFNPRQKLSLIVFAENVRQLYTKLIADGHNEDYAKVIVSYQAIAIDRLADKNSTFVLYDTGYDKISHVFGRQALGIVWDYVELNPFTNVGWKNMNATMINTIEHCSMIEPSREIKITLASATELPYPDNFFDAVFTDPPYYDNIPYSHLSDYFYVWLKRSIGHLYPEFFSTPLTPKSKEIVAYSNMEGGWEAGKQFFENMLGKAFIEINRVLKPNGIAIIVYAHKSTAGWETLLNSLLDSGLVVTAAWPINTEMKGRLRDKESAVLGSSIYMIARKLGRQPTGFYREIKDELRNHLNTRLDKLWNEGIAGADFFIAAIGSSIEILGKYSKVIDDEGTIIRADGFLEIVRTIVTDYAVHKILHNGFAAQITQMTRFYLLWRWAYGEVDVPFDDARKLAQSVGIDLAHEWNNKNSFIQKDKEIVRVLGPDDREVDDYQHISKSKELVDVLHSALLLWKKGKKEELLSLLKESGFGKNDILYRVAQAISETLPNASKEKKLLEGFLVGKGRISDGVMKDAGQRRLFD